ncbi:hypothetical protein XU18_2769 [Perkinsela sp. CCAP 1560/4]|nr:hypothetical protein XU18_2769 [Perkinsela sp. CCAP 1560/4]|eukprot:KNH06264.1 hypothetical protein XU18_2769 [Perkinsela sp. CCAP 1560/4]
MAVNTPIQYTHIEMRCQLEVFMMNNAEQTLFEKIKLSCFETACFTARFEIVTYFFNKSQIVFAAIVLLSINIRLFLNAFHSELFISIIENPRDIWHPYCSTERVFPNV